jgi:alpha-D-ribose 1-methylphosphonate 5-phosphate C-P lyase
MASTPIKRNQPKCAVCGAPATHFCKVRIDDDQGNEHEVGEIDLCDEHFDTWKPKIP